MPRPAVICFMGIDGSGKTTLAKWIAKELKLKGLRTQYAYARYVPVFTRPLVVLGAIMLNKATRAGAGPNRYEEYIDNKRRILHKGPLARIMEVLIIAEYSLQLVLKVRLRSLVGKTVVCDRYVYDTIATDLAPDLQYSRSEIIRWINRFLRVAPSPTILMYLRVSPDVANSRKADVPDPSYLHERAQLYEFIAETYAATVVDANRGVKEVEEEALGIVLSHLNSRNRHR